MMDRLSTTQDSPEGEDSQTFKISLYNRRGNEHYEQNYYAQEKFTGLLLVSFLNRNETTTSKRNWAENKASCIRKDICSMYTW